MYEHAEVIEPSVKRFSGGNLFMTAGLLRRVPLGEILGALGTHEFEFSRQECHPHSRFTTKHCAPDRSDFLVTTDCASGLTSLYLTEEPTGL